MPPRSDKADHAAYKEDAAYKAVRNAFTVCVLKVAPDKNPPDQKDHFTKLQQDLKAKNDVLDKWVENNLYKPKPDDTGDGKMVFPQTTVFSGDGVSWVSHPCTGAFLILSPLGGTRFSSSALSIGTKLVHVILSPLGRSSSPWDKGALPEPRT